MGQAPAFSNIHEYDRVYGRRLYDVASVYDHIIRIRQRYLADAQGRLLDHGFGNGVIAEYFRREGFDVFGVETSAAARDLVVARAREAGLAADQFHVIPADSAAMPFADDSFDAVVSNQVLYFLPSREQIDATVREFVRILKSGGKVACTIMAENNYYFTKCAVPPVPVNGMVDVRVRGRIERDFRLYRFGDARDVRATFEQAGFAVDDIGYFDFRLLDVECAKHYIVLAHKPRAIGR